MRIYGLIASGQTLSAGINLSQFARVDMIEVPSVTSGDLLLRGSFDVSSPEFKRMQYIAPTSGDLRIPVGVGSLMATLPVGFPAPPMLQLETSVAQTSPRSFTILTRR